MRCRSEVAEFDNLGTPSDTQFQYDSMNKTPLAPPRVSHENIVPPVYT